MEIKKKNFIYAYTYMLYALSIQRSLRGQTNKFENALLLPTFYLKPSRCYLDVQREFELNNYEIILSYFMYAKPFLQWSLGKNLNIYFGHKTFTQRTFIWPANIS